MILLIIDDNPQMRRLIRSIVGDLAEIIFECGDGASALTAYVERRPDWVLMDIKMPLMDGITATRRLKTAFPEARVLIVTDYDDADLRESAREAGAENYVIKEELLDLRHFLLTARTESGRKFSQ